MGCTTPFFLPYLSQAGADRDRIKDYLLNFHKWQEQAKDADGYLRNLSFMIFNDGHFNKEIILAETNRYDYFNYRKAPSRSNAFYERIMDLCSRSILRDPMGSDKRLIDIYGYTPADLLDMDYASLIDIEERINEIEKEHDRHMTETTKTLEKEHAEIQSQKPQ
jgi:hypothetical protein